MRKKLLVLAFILALVGASLDGIASDGQVDSQSQAKISSIPMAITIAMQDFTSRLHKEKDLSWQWGEYVSDTRNYAVGAVEQESYYVVVFVLRQPAERINGGGGRYKIDKMSGKWTFLGFE